MTRVSDSRWNSVDNVLEFCDVVWLEIRIEEPNYASCCTL